MFTGKQRPKGLEFASCQACNNGTRHADLVASLLGRLFPNPTTAVEKGDIHKLMQAVGNNVPGVLKEMTIGPAGEFTARRISEGGIVRVDGPLITEHMGVFAAKLGFSTHFEAFGSPVPPEGGVLPFWFSNIQAMKGEIPEGFTKYLPELKTLKQGTVDVGEQFQYAWMKTDERQHCVTYAEFRLSFVVFVVSTLDKKLYLDTRREKFPVFAPGDFRKISR